jgi:hypothetical protein
MATTNEITGDKLVSKSSTQKYRDNFDKIFNKKVKKKVKPKEEDSDVQEQ